MLGLPITIEAVPLTFGIQSRVETNIYSFLLFSVVSWTHMGKPFRLMEALRIPRLVTEWKHEAEMAKFYTEDQDGAHGGKEK